MSNATHERISTGLARIPARHTIREAFAGCSTNGKSTGYYETKGHAVCAFDEVLAAYALHFDPDDCVGVRDNEGWITLSVLNAADIRIGYARLSWYRMPSGRYEVVGYLA
jgi:hypothetical protein